MPASPLAASVATAAARWKDRGKKRRLNSEEREEGEECRRKWQSGDDGDDEGKDDSGDDCDEEASGLLIRQERLWSLRA